MTTKPIKLDVNEQIESAHTLASRFYTDPAILDAEKSQIFRRTWQLVGTLDTPCGESGEQTGTKRTIADPETFFTVDVIGEPVVVVRDKQSTLRAFSNVCRHRAGPIAQGSGCKNVLRCGYHGWTYALDGALISATEIEGVEGFRAEDFALAPVRTEEWFNLIFANLDPNAPPLRQCLGELRPQAEKFAFADMKLFERRTYDMKCNWKTYVDNYLEGYHLPSVHPGLNRELDYNAYAVEPYARHVRQFSPIRGAQPGDATPRRYQEAAEDLTTDYFWIFPNWMLNCYPDNVSLNVVLPVEPERTLAIFEWYLPEKDHSAPAAKASVEFSDQIQIEDVGICEAVQRNLRSRSYSRGRYSVKQEKGVHAFHRMYADFMKEH